MAVTEYFFDTYAAIELVRKSPAYQRFLEVKIRLTFLNLLEIAYIIHSQHGEKEGVLAFHSFKEFVVSIPDEVVLKTLTFRFQNRKKSLSYADCLGYMYARHFGLIFLTGDDAFKGLPDVEFVK